MSASSMPPERRRSAKGGGATSMPEAATYALPLTVSREALLDGGSDRGFRSLVGDLFTISARMELVREHLARRLGITGPQYSLIVAVAHLQGQTGSSVGSIAQSLHVSSAFVASETGKLVRRGFLLKRVDPLDRRGVLLSIAPAGRLKLDRISEEIRALNDVFFGSLEAKAFAGLSQAMATLVDSSAQVARRLHDLKTTAQTARRAIA